MAKSLNKIFEISLLAASVLLVSCSSDNDKDNDANQGATETVAAKSVISVNGGAGIAGSGGNGGAIVVNNNSGAAAIKVEMQLQAFESDITVPSHNPSFGAKLVRIDSDTSIQAIAKTEPETKPDPAEGGFYTYGEADAYNLYISDGDGVLGNETAVTGLHIASGAKLLLESSASLTLSLANDLQNDGVITTTAAGMKVSISAANYIGSAASQVVLSDLEPGDAAGNLTLMVSESFYNEGKILANGQSDLDNAGGAGGSVFVQAQTDIYNSGAIEALAGNSFATKPGGQSGTVKFEAENDLVNAGKITVKPGAGYSSTRTSDIDIVLQGNTVVNAGDLTAPGVSSATSNATNDALNGGKVTLTAKQNSIVNTGDITVNGATPNKNIAATNGGKGGAIIFEVSNTDAEGTGVYISGQLLANGGKANVSGAGGEGGSVELSGAVSVGDWLLTGYEKLQANGAASSDAQGGNGGTIELDGKNIDVARSDLNAAAGAGNVYGKGGVITFNYTGVVDSPEENAMKIVADINIEGHEGQLDISHDNGNVKYAGKILADAKNRNGNDYGNHGASLSFAGNVIDIKGRISANGSNGSTEGGTAGSMTFDFVDTIALNMLVKLNGGNADSSIGGSTGGDGGDIYLRGLKKKDFSKNSVNYNAYGGKGANAGELGCIYLSDAKLPDDESCP